MKDSPITTTPVAQSEKNNSLSTTVLGTVIGAIIGSTVTKMIERRPSSPVTEPSLPVIVKPTPSPALVDLRCRGLMMISLSRSNLFRNDVGLMKSSIDNNPEYYFAIINWIMIRSDAGIIRALEENKPATKVRIIKGLTYRMLYGRSIAILPQDSAIVFEYADGLLSSSLQTHGSGIHMNGPLRRDIFNYVSRDLVLAIANYQSGDHPIIMSQLFDVYDESKTDSENIENMTAILRDIESGRSLYTPSFQVTSDIMQYITANCRITIATNPQRGIFTYIIQATRPTAFSNADAEILGSYKKFLKI